MIKNKSGRGLFSQREILALLSENEARVFCMLGMGYTPKRIASHRECSVKTVESYIERIRGKLSLGPHGHLQYDASYLMRIVAFHGIMGNDAEVIDLLLSFRQKVLGKSRHALKSL